MAVRMGSAAKVVTFGGFNCCVISFPVPDVGHTVSKASAELWRLPSSSSAQRFRRVVQPVFLESHCQGCAKGWQRAKFHVRCGICDLRWKLMETAQNIDFEVVDLRLHNNSEQNLGFVSTKCEIYRSLPQSARFEAACLDALVFVWRRRACKGSCKTFHFRRFPSRF